MTNPTPPQYCDPLEATIYKLFGERIRHDDSFCTQMWSALANVSWYFRGEKESHAFSFRSAGALIAEIRGHGDYMDWYCSGPIANVCDEIAKGMAVEGWRYEAND